MAKGGKQPGAGRPAGSKNVNTPDIKMLARKYTDMCITQLANIAMKSMHEHNRIAAINSLLERGWGKPTQNIGTEDDKPIGLVIRWEK